MLADGLPLLLGLYFLHVPVLCLKKKSLVAFKVCHVIVRLHYEKIIKVYALNTLYTFVSSHIINTYK